MLFLTKFMADPKAYRLEISGPSLRFVVIYMTPVRTVWEFLVWFQQPRRSQTGLSSL